MMTGPGPDAAHRAVALAQAGRIEEAYRLLDQASSGGNALAAATLADWRMAGDLIRRDLKLARDLYGRAAEFGLAEARPVHIALLANGAGGTTRHWRKALKLLRQRASGDPLAKRQSALLERMALDAEGDPLAPPSQEALSESPKVAQVRNFMTPDECAYLIERASPLFQASVVIHPVSGQFVRDPVRTSSAALFPFAIEDPVVHALNRRIAAVTATRYEQGEPLQVLSYAPGQEYKLHSDALGPGANQRIRTLLVFLNEDFEGGETHFPQAGLRHRGKTGDAVVFHNVTPDGAPDPRAIHAGLPVTRGRKLILSKWIRAEPLDLSGPPGRPF